MRGSERLRMKESESYVERDAGIQGGSGKEKEGERMRGSRCRRERE